MSIHCHYIDTEVPVCMAGNGCPNAISMLHDASKSPVRQEKIVEICSSNKEGSILILVQFYELRDRLRSLLPDVRIELYTFDWKDLPYDILILGTPHKSSCEHVPKGKDVHILIDEDNVVLRSIGYRMKSILSRINEK